MRIVALLLAVVCSILLAALTVAPPPVPTDWARLDGAGMYTPQEVVYDWPSYVVQVGLWLGIVGGAWVGGRQGFQTPGYAKKAISPLKGLKILPVISLTLLGFGLRVHTLDELPLIVDEIGFAAHASDILHGQHVPIFAPGHNANPSAYSWMVAGAMALCGQNAFAIRLMPLFFGTLSVPAVYLLGRVWWSRRVGLAAAAFVATYPAHVFYSRMSLYNIIDPVFAMLALAALGRALQRGARRDYVLAGMLAACGQYFYHGSRLVVVLGLLAVGYWLSAERQKTQRKGAKVQRRREIIYGLLWMTTAFGVMTLPRFAPMVVGGLPVEGNREAMRLPDDFWPENTLRAALAWIGERDASPFWLSDAPLLLFPALALFVVGLAVSARRWRDGRYGVLLASVALTTIFGGAIWTAAPLYVRYMTAIPAIGLLVAVGYWLLAVSKNVWIHYMGVALLGVICLQGVIVSLGEHPAEARGRISGGQWWMDDTARGAASLGDDVPVVLVAPPEFGELERITLADYVAAYGRRRAVSLIEP